MEMESVDALRRVKDARTEQLEALIARLSVAVGGDRELDHIIAYATGNGDPRDNSPPGVPRQAYVWYPKQYTASLDAALTLYTTRPEFVPTNPIKACLEALRQW